MSAFNNSCDAGDTVTDGSCTQAFGYWSSTSGAGFPSAAWLVFFADGGVFLATKDFVISHVRAVRGGSP